MNQPDQTISSRINQNCNREVESHRWLLPQAAAEQNDLGNFLRNIVEVSELKPCRWILNKTGSDPPTDQIQQEVLVIQISLSE